MAVKKVFGRVDGVEVILQWAEGDRWSVPVPLDQDGEYVVEIIAEDEAGNQAYMAKMLFVVNTALLCVHVIPVPYYGVLQDDLFALDVVSNTFECAATDDKLIATICHENYYSEIINPVCNLVEGGG